MGKRRMISNEILESDRVYTLSNNAKLLYIYLIMAGDDDGFVGSAKKILKELDLDERYVEELLLADLIHQFDSSVLLIMDWKIHNQIAPSKYQGTLYETERRYLSRTKSKRYVIMSEEDLRINAIEESSLENNSSCSAINKAEKAKEFEAKVLAQKMYKSIVISE